MNDVNSVIFKDNIDKQNRDAWMDEPIKAKGWRNRYFLKTGESYNGWPVYSTREECESVQGKTVEDHDIFGPRICWMMDGTRALGRKIWNDDISHIIAMPIGES